MNLLLKLSVLIDNLNKRAGKIAGYGAALMVLVVFVDVVMRYVFKSSFVFTQELEWHLFAFVFLIGAGYTLFSDGHVRVDIFYQKLSAKGRAWVNLIGVLLFLMPGCFVIIKTSLVFVYNSWAVLEGSSDPGGIPLRFIVKSFIPIGFVFVFLQGLSLGIKSLAIITEKDIKQG